LGARPDNLNGVIHVLIYVGAVLLAAFSIGIVTLYCHHRLDSFLVQATAWTLGLLNGVVFSWFASNGYKTDAIGICVVFLGAFFQAVSGSVIRRDKAYLQGSTLHERAPAIVMTDDLKDGFALGSWILICMGLVLQVLSVAMAS
jgi:hypothetical protein